MSNRGSTVALLKFLMAPMLMLLISSGSKKKEPRCTCLSEAKAPHSQRMWAEVYSFTPHLLHNGLSSSPSRWRCFLRVLCPVRRPFTALDWVLLKDIPCVSSETNLERNVDLEKYMGMIWRQVLQLAYVARCWLELVKHSVIWHRFSLSITIVILFYFCKNCTFNCMFIYW